MDCITGTAVLEFDPAETLSPVGAIIAGLSPSLPTAPPPMARTPARKAAPLDLDALLPVRDRTHRWREMDSNFQFRARWATVSKLCPRPARSAIGAGVSSEQLLTSPNAPTKSSWTDSGVPALSSRPLVDSNSVTFMSR